MLAGHIAGDWERLFWTASIHSKWGNLCVNTIESMIWSPSEPAPWHGFVMSNNSFHCPYFLDQIYETTYFIISCTGGTEHFILLRILRTSVQTWQILKYLQIRCVNTVNLLTIMISGLISSLKCLDIWRTTHYNKWWAVVKGLNPIELFH